MIQVILSGDDFGLAPGINEGILEAHTRGCLTSASLSVAGPHAEAAVRAARDCPDLGIGLHLTLVDEAPVSPPGRVASLLRRGGRFHASAFVFARRWMAGLIRPDEVRLETRTQLERVRELGVTLTHLDSHQHLHVLPGVFEIVAEEMQAAGLSRVRIPLELERLPGAGGAARRAFRFALNRLSRRAAARAATLGLSAPDRFLGFLGAGSLDTAALLARIAVLRDGVTEIGMHPAAGELPPRADFGGWGYSWGAEFEALCAPEVAAALAERGAHRIHYGQLPSRA